MQTPAVEFYCSVHQLEDLPVHGYPEVAFVGRSNVGKSTLLNMLAHRKQIAKISSTPGKTRSLNYFTVGKGLFFVDLPGYGFARVSRKEQAKWQMLIEGYFQQSKHIALVLHLVDSRQGMTATDRMLAEWIAPVHLPVIVVCTKCDKIKQNARRQLVQKLKADTVHAVDVCLYSAKEPKTTSAIWQLIHTYLSSDPLMRRQL